jgi:hypothetical protein
MPTSARETSAVTRSWLFRRHFLNPLPRPRRIRESASDGRTCPSIGIKSGPGLRRTGTAQLSPLRGRAQAISDSSGNIVTFAGNCDGKGRSLKVIKSHFAKRDDPQTSHARQFRRAGRLGCRAAVPRGRESRKVLPLYLGKWGLWPTLWIKMYKR